jgi:metal-responsive CopG/Arc/MetJ family transcriptional regulator
VAVVVFFSRMKSKTSITLSEDLLVSVKRAARKGESRSETIERLLRERLSEEAARRAREKETALINRHADELNAEALDVLDYQVEP